MKTLDSLLETRNYNDYSNLTSERKPQAPNSRAAAGTFKGKPRLSVVNLDKSANIKSDCVDKLKPVRMSMTIVE